MSWTNYHGHSHFCDGKGTPDEYVEAAIAKGMRSIGFSSHAPVPFESFWNMPKERLPEYISEINRLKKLYAGQVDVHLSLEIDYVEGIMGPSDALYQQLGLDYTIGSVHFMGQFGDGEHWAIDGSFESFEKGLMQIYDGDIKKLVCDFYRLQRQMLEIHKPTILGHLDKIKMHNAVKPLFDESAQWYRNEVRNLLEIAANKGTIVEINTKSWSRNGMLFPGEEYFSWLHELKIPVVINSDAHYPDHLDVGFGEVAEKLQRYKINELAYLKNSKWESVAYCDKGLLG